MVPVLLLTGFLGSGKTTLLNRLLDERPRNGPFAEASGNLALIVNEFGDVGIDGDLLPDDLTKQIEIKGGCICCRLDGDLEKTLIGLLENQPDLTAIIIETTGIAEPLPISWTLAEPGLVEHFRLAAVITVVDSLEHERHRPMSPSVDAQVDYADLLLMTKLDLVGPDQIEAVRDSLRQRNEVAPIFAGNTPDLVTSLWMTIDDPSFERIPTKEHVHIDTHEHTTAQPFGSIALPINGIIDYETLVEELEALPPNYVRIKGFARAIDASSGTSTSQMIAFHRVGARMSAEPANDDVETRIVVIGTDIVDEDVAACVGKAMINSD